MNKTAQARVALLIRIPASLKKKLAALAERDKRSVNQEIEYLLEKALREQSEN